MVLRDQEILSLCRARDQRAIAALAEKYGAYCHTVAHNILGDHPDAEECVNDAYLAVWNGVPSAPPRSLLAYLAKVTRNIALKRLEHNQAQKRGDRFYLLLDELAEVLKKNGFMAEGLGEGFGDEMKDVSKTMQNAIPSDFDLDMNDTVSGFNFLKTKTDRGERQLFLRRYFWGDSIGELTVLFRHSESKVKSQLFRTRQRLRGYLGERGLLG